MPEEFVSQREKLRLLLLAIIDEAENHDIAAGRLTQVILAKRHHIEGKDGERAVQEEWTEAQCRLMIELMI